MTITYKKFKDPYGNVVTSAINKYIDGVHVLCLPFDEANTDYQEYLKWKALDGNEPLEAD